jgi:hypothetical protein
MIVVCLTGKPFEILNHGVGIATLLVFRVLYKETRNTKNLLK